jgi:hypothetical protein
MNVNMVASNGTRKPVGSARTQWYQTLCLYSTRVKLRLHSGPNACCNNVAGNAIPMPGLHPLVEEGGWGTFSTQYSQIFQSQISHEEAELDIVLHHLAHCRCSMG